MISHLQAYPNSVGSNESTPQTPAQSHRSIDPDSGDEERPEMPPPHHMSTPGGSIGQGHSCLAKPLQDLDGKSRLYRHLATRDHHGGPLNNRRSQ